MTTTIKAHRYKHMSREQQEEIFSNYLFNSWSYSKVSSFARNEKAFEMTYIYNKPFRKSASMVAGYAYHRAMEYYFNERLLGHKQDVANLQKVAYAYIDDVEANQWKLQKTTPTIESCIAKATDTSTDLINNFFADISIFDDEIESILFVELPISDFLTINGVDIPLPCKAVIDLVIQTKDGKKVIIDHKSKATYTDEKDLKFSIGKQAITYVKLYESITKEKVDEVWFIENKASKNKDKSPQLNRFKIAMDNDTRRLYEAMLYEPLKRMLEAISDPDYIYLINENDNFVDKAEIYEFWAQTMMAEVGDFNIADDKKELITKRLKKIRDVSIATVDPKAIRNFRKNAAEFIQYDLSNKTDMTNKEKIEHTLRSLGTIVNVAHTIEGYSSNTYLLEVSAGTNLASVQKYRLDIANALNVSSVRMMKDLLVYQGKSYLAVEASKPREKDLLFDSSYLSGYRIPIGVDNFGNNIVWDLDNPSTPHALICGSTGSGKSVCIVSIIEYAKAAGMEEVIIFDPKYEFNRYGSVYNDIDDIEAMMEMQVEEMNARVKKGINKKTLIIFDEFADAVAASRKQKTKKSLEENLRILLQKGRSSGYRIVAATQRASVKVITGDAKVNFPVQICFKVPKEVDSKVVLDEAGAESLAGKGDGLIKSPEYPGVVRFQAFYHK